MPGIFISYRREDGQGFAGRLFDRLVHRFGQERVFRDIEGIGPGEKFAQVIAERIADCDVLIVLIGKGWLMAKDVAGRRRLDLVDDYVREEIAGALAQHKFVIPVLAENAQMPARGDLPDAIATLTEFNALPLADARFDFDFDRLALVISEHVTPHFAEKPIPKAIQGKFNIAVVHLERDNNGEMEHLLLESLAEFPGIATLSFDRQVASDQGDREQAENDGHERARALLRESGADVLIWGVVLRKDGNSLPKLYWTPVQAVGNAASGRYSMTDELSLPPLFWQDLMGLLGLLIANSDTEFSAHDGCYTVDKLAPFIERVRRLLQSSKADHWRAEPRTKVKLVLAGALSTYGKQSGRNEPLLEAVGVYREILMEISRDEVSVRGAIVQNNLGNALLALGERDSSSALLDEAVAAYSEALRDIGRDKFPLDWAIVQNNLGVALTTLGARAAEPTMLTASVSAFREVLTEWTRDKAPLRWATTQNNLGLALLALGKRTSDSEQLTQALAAFREAMREWTLGKAPLFWGIAQNNVGRVLLILGDRESDLVQLNEAVAACRAALQACEGDKVPLQWAMMQRDLGSALLNLGTRESSPELLAEAVIAFRGALQEQTRDKVPVEWAMTQDQLGSSLKVLAELRSDSTLLIEAVNAYQEALKECSRDKLPLDWARIQNNLGNALQILGRMELNPRWVFEGLAAFHDALEEIERDEVPFQWASTQNNLGIAYAILSEIESNPKLLFEAARAFEAALSAYREVQAQHYVAVAERNLRSAREAIAKSGGSGPLFR